MLDLRGGQTLWAKAIAPTLAYDQVTKFGFDKNWQGISKNDANTFSHMKPDLQMPLGYHKRLYTIAWVLGRFSNSVGITELRPV